jgi:hypothetical protein
MHLMRMSPEGARLALRAMKTVAGVDGDVAPLELALIEAAGAMTDEPIAASLAPISLEELRGASLEPKDAERVVQAAILTALMDEKIEGAEVTRVAEIASALGVSEPRVKNLAQLARGQVKLAWLDLARRSFARDLFERALLRDGPAGLWKIVGPMLGRADDPELARRYLDLGSLSEDTVGYAYFRLVVDNGLGFPGEPYSVPESGTWHDIAHVLGDFGTSPAEEVQVVAFIAGNTGTDPFFWLFTIACQFHLGMKMSPYSAPERGLFDPVLAMRAFERGAATNVDLSAPAFDPWPLFPRRLEDVRRELGVPPR